MKGFQIPPEAVEDSIFMSVCTAPQADLHLEHCKIPGSYSVVSKHIYRNIQDRILWFLLAYFGDKISVIAFIKTSVLKIISNK